MTETLGMSQEDSRSAQPMSRQIEEWAERRMRNVAETYVTKVDSNAELQKNDPEHYGPYLEEGESYQAARTAGNLEKANSICMWLCFTCDKKLMDPPPSTTVLRRRLTTTSSQGSRRMTGSPHRAS